MIFFFFRKKNILKMWSTYQVSIVTCGSISWFIFNLDRVFVNFVELSPNFHYFCLIQS